MCENKKTNLPIPGIQDKMANIFNRSIDSSLQVDLNSRSSEIKDVVLMNHNNSKVLTIDDKPIRIGKESKHIPEVEHPATVPQVLTSNINSDQNRIISTERNSYKQEINEGCIIEILEHMKYSFNKSIKLVKKKSTHLNTEHETRIYVSRTNNIKSINKASGKVSPENNGAETSTNALPQQSVDLSKIQRKDFTTISNSTHKKNPENKKTNRKKKNM